MGLIDPDKQAERKDRRQERRKKLRVAIDEALGEWHADHKVDADEIPALRAAAIDLLKHAGLTSLDALDGQVTTQTLGPLKDASINFLIVLAGALED